MSHLADLGNLGDIPAQHFNALQQGWQSTRVNILRKVRYLGLDANTRKNTTDAATRGFSSVDGCWLASGQADPDGNTRNAALWAHAVAATTQPPAAGSQGANPYSATTHVPATTLALPAYSVDPKGAWQDDSGIVPQPVSPAGGGDLPGGVFGVALPMSVWTRQDTAFIPAGNMLIDPWAGGSSTDRFGSLVWDVTAAGKLDKDRKARVQSAWRTYRLPQSSLVPFGAPPVNTTPQTLAPSGLALQLNLDVGGQAGWGMVADTPDSLSAPTQTPDPKAAKVDELNRAMRVNRARAAAAIAAGPAGAFALGALNDEYNSLVRQLALVEAGGAPDGATSGAPPPPGGSGATNGRPPEKSTSSSTKQALGALGRGAGGFVNAGGGTCPHVLGVNDDGETLYSAHVDEAALIRGPTGDAPFAYDPTPWIPPTEKGPFWFEVYARNDLGSTHPWAPDGAKQGLRRWETTGYHDKPPPTQRKNPADDQMTPASEGFVSQPGTYSDPGLSASSESGLTRTAENTQKNPADDQLSASGEASVSQPGTYADPMGGGGGGGGTAFTVGAEQSSGGGGSGGGAAGGSSGGTVFTSGNEKTGGGGSPPAPVPGGGVRGPLPSSPVTETSFSVGAEAVPVSTPLEEMTVTNGHLDFGPGGWTGGETYPGVQAEGVIPPPDFGVDFYFQSPSGPQTPIPAAAALALPFGFNFLESPGVAGNALAVRGTALSNPRTFVRSPYAQAVSALLAYPPLLNGIDLQTTNGQMSAAALAQYNSTPIGGQLVGFGAQSSGHTFDGPPSSARWAGGASLHGGFALLPANTDQIAWQQGTLPISTPTQQVAFLAGTYNSNIGAADINQAGQIIDGFVLGRGSKTTASLDWADSNGDYSLPPALYFDSGVAAPDPPPTCYIWGELAVTVAATASSGQVPVADGVGGYAWASGSSSAATALATTGADVNVSSAAPPAAGYALTATDATHAIWRAAFAYGGDGSDGAVDMDGTNTYASFASKSGSVYTLNAGDVNATTFRVRNGVELITASYPGGSYRVRATISITVDDGGKITANGQAGSGVNQGVGPGAGSLGDARDGGAGATGAAAGTAGGSDNNSLGGNGAAGGAATNTGGAAGTTTAPMRGTWQFGPVLSTGILLDYNTLFEAIIGGAGGGGGGGAAAGSRGGGGGGGGGVIALAAPVISIGNTSGGAIQSKGGAGAAGTNTGVGAAGGGGGGGGGCALLVARILTVTSSSFGGGAGGAGIGGGAAGASASAGNYYSTLA